MNAGVHISPEIAAVRAWYAPVLTGDHRRRPIREQLKAEAARLLEAHRAGDPVVEVQIASWHPDRIGQRADAILAASLSEAEARLTIAREYGYRDWTRVEGTGAAAPDADFDAAVDAALGGDVEGLRNLLAAQPGLANQRSEYGHRAGLLHYLAANGVETRRQVVPRNAVAIVTALIGAGSDVNAEAPIYGGSRPLTLLLTSAHPRAAGLTDDLSEALRAAGAK